MAEYEGRCMKCKKQVKMANAKETTIKGRTTMRAVKGECPVCKTKVCRILGKA